MRAAMRSAIDAGRKRGISSPLGIANLAQWFRADIGVTLNGSNVSGWADQSGNARHASQAAGASQPLFVASSTNGKPGLTFDGGDSMTHTYAIAAACTIFAVAKASPNTLGTVSYNGIITLGTTGAGMGSTTGNSEWGTSILGADAQKSGVSMSAVTPSQQIAVFRNFNDVDLYPGAGAKVTRTAGTSWVGLSSQGSQIGYTNGTRFLLGTLYEIAVYSRALTAAEVALLQAYARGFWAVL